MQNQISERSTSNVYQFALFSSVDYMDRCHSICEIWHVEKCRLVCMAVCGQCI